jgi:predicted ATP-grasp superfamily ATP-dependent carboligase
MDSTRVFVYETTSADPHSADPALLLQGQAMLDAMVADLAKVHGVEVTAAAGIGATSPVVAPVRQAKQGRDESPVEFLRRHAAVHDLVWVVAPETGGLLSLLRATVTDDQWLGCSREAIDIAASKRATARHLRAAGIAAPLSLPSSLSAHRPGVREGFAGNWIVKPDDGCGATGARRHQDYAAALADFRERRNVVMEHWIDGEPLSLSLLCRGDETELLAINRQLIAFDDSGWLRFDGVTRARAITDEQAQAMSLLAAKVVQALPGLSGFVGIDVTWHPDQGPTVIEINPRVTSAYEGLSARLGRNLAGEIVAAHRHDATRRTVRRILDEKLNGCG